MTKERLKKLKKLQKEAEQLEEQIKQLPFQTGDYVADTAKDYSHGFPRTIKIEGYSTEKYDRYKRKLQNKLHKINDEVIELEEWLDNVDDPEVRAILRMQYAQGLSHEQIADTLKCARETVTRKIKKFWESH